MKWTGIVTPGNQEATKLGTPTANIYVTKEHSVLHGLYIGSMCTQTGVYPSIIYISSQSDHLLKIEAHAIGYTDLDLYHTQITVETIEFIREPHNFSNVTESEIKQYIQNDIQKCSNQLHPWIPILHAISEFKSGNPVIIMDDLERENEGDLVYPAQSITPQNITDTLEVSSGIICVTLTEEKAQKLHLPVMYKNNEDPNGTNFTVSIDHISTTTGVSAHDRAKTIRELVASENPKDFTRPGHLFPLVAKNGLLRERQGHTEASVELCLLSGLEPVGVICELMNRDGSMMRLKECTILSKKHNIPLISVKDICAYSEAVGFVPGLKEASLEWSECELYTHGYSSPFRFRVAKDYFTQSEVGMLCTQSFNPKDNPLIRIHSECLTGNVFHSQMCDCHYQLHAAIKEIYTSGNGCVLYATNHEGRGIGLLEKIKAYKLQSEGEDTVSANLKLGWKADQRDYSFCIRVLKDMGITRFRMLSNNPDKIITFAENFSIDAVHFKSENHSLNQRYLQTKIDKMNHSNVLLSTSPSPSESSSESFEINREKVKGKHVCVVNTVWNREYTQVATTKILKVLQSYGVYVSVVTVPGAFEIPVKCKQALFSSVEDRKIDCIIAVGVVLKGETMHFEYICESVYRGLMDVQLDMGVPIINGVLACLTKKHIEDRIYSSLPEDWALSGLMMMS